MCGIRPIFFKEILPGMHARPTAVIGAKTGKRLEAGRNAHAVLPRTGASWEWPEDHANHPDARCFEWLLFGPIPAAQKHSSATRLSADAHFWILKQSALWIPMTTIGIEVKSRFHNI
jgi:hypothetical protein